MRERYDGRAGRRDRRGMEDDAGFRAAARRRDAPRGDAGDTPEGRSFFRGQEYGLPADPNRNAGQDLGYGSRRDGEGRLRWSPGDGEPYGELEMEGRNRGIEQYGPPADYAFRPETGHELSAHDLDPHYLDWRERRMAQHDRDYQAWRRERRRQYDEDYRRSRGRR